MPKRAVPRSVPTPARSAAETRQILQKLYGQHPGADTELHFSNAYELLVATILSAQCTDERVNQVTPALFRRYPDARALAKATTTELEPQIQSTGFFRAKSRSLVGMATSVVEQHDGEIPRTMEDLVALPGVGRKTANVVLGHALGVPGLPVDRHVLRVANRIGIARSEDPVIVEQQLCAAVPPADWTRTSDTLILHGRRICKPRPLCDRCAVRQECEYYRTVVGLGLGSKKAVGLKPAGVRLKPDTTTARRGAKRRVARPIGEIRSDRSDSRQPSKMGKASSLRDAQEAPPDHPGSRLSSDVRRAAKPRVARPIGEIRSDRSDSRQPPKMGKASSLRDAQEAPPDRPESGPSSKVRRAAKPRGTGRGGGAPRQTKK
jgi:endonuclease-3